MGASLECTSKSRAPPSGETLLGAAGLSCWSERTPALHTPKVSGIPGRSASCKTHNAPGRIHRYYSQKLVNYLNDPTFLAEVISEMGLLSSANSPQEVKVTHDGDAIVTKTSNQENSFAQSAEKNARTLAADRTFARVLSTHTH